MRWRCAKTTKKICSRIQTIMSRRKGCRRLDMSRSLERYRQRLSEWPPSKFETLRDAYLSTYEVYSTIADPDAADQNGGFCCFAAVLLRVAREKGVLVKGLTSERKTRGQYIVGEIDGKPRSEVCCVYVGKYSYFGGCEKSVFAPVQADCVYYS